MIHYLHVDPVSSLADAAAVVATRRAIRDRLVDAYELIRDIDPDDDMPADLGDRFVRLCARLARVENATDEQAVQLAADLLALADEVRTALDPFLDLPPLGEMEHAAE